MRMSVNVTKSADVLIMELASSPLGICLSSKAPSCGNVLRLIVSDIYTIKKEMMNVHMSIIQMLLFISHF